MGKLQALTRCLGGMLAPCTIHLQPARRSAPHSAEALPSLAQIHLEGGYFRNWSLCISTQESTVNQASKPYRLGSCKKQEAHGLEALLGMYGVAAGGPWMVGNAYYQWARKDKYISGVRHLAAIIRG
eukprot:525839-Pelagomonas_calceolata.AAC.7